MYTQHYATCYYRRDARTVQDEQKPFGTTIEEEEENRKCVCVCVVCCSIYVFHYKVRLDFVAASNTAPKFCLV